MKRGPLIAVSLLAWATPLHAQEANSYFCTTEKLTGFSVQSGEWETVQFSPFVFVLKYQQGLMKKAPDEWAWSLTEHGQATYAEICSDDLSRLGYGLTGRGSYVNCNGLYKLKFNKKTLRFLVSYFIGYTDGVDKNENTPSIGIGKCSPI